MDRRLDWLVDQIPEKYEYLDYLGGGGFGDVLKVRNRPLDRTEALKMILFLRDDQPFERLEKDFYREAQVMDLLGQESPYIIRVFDIGLLAVPGGFFTMEFVPGRTLYRLCQDEGQLEEERVLPLADQICSALELAHRTEVGDQGALCHRDLKLRNIIIHEGGYAGEEVRVLDFGLVRLASHSGGTDTRLYGARGTPGCAAPEQVRGERVTPSVDVFGMGVLLYELFTGHEAWQGKEISNRQSRDYSRYYFELCTSPRGPEPIPPRQFRSDLNPQLEDTILRCLRPRPEERFQTATELRQALSDIGGTTKEAEEEAPAAGSSELNRDASVVWDAAEGLAQSGTGPYTVTSEDFPKPDPPETEVVVPGTEVAPRAGAYTAITIATAGVISFVAVFAVAVSFSIGPLRGYFAWEEALPLVLVGFLSLAIWPTSRASLADGATMLIVGLATASALLNVAQPRSPGALAAIVSASTVVGLLATSLKGRGYLGAVFAFLDPTKLKGSVLLSIVLGLCLLSFVLPSALDPIWSVRYIAFGAFFLLFPALSWAGTRPKRSILVVIVLGLAGGALWLISDMIIRVASDSRGTAEPSYWPVLYTGWVMAAVAAPLAAATLMRRSEAKTFGKRLLVPTVCGLVGNGLHHSFVAIALQFGFLGLAPVHYAFESSGYLIAGFIAGWSVLNSPDRNSLLEPGGWREASVGLGVLATIVIAAITYARVLAGPS